MSELWMQKRRQKGQAPQPSPNIANFSMRRMPAPLYRLTRQEQNVSSQAHLGDNLNVQSRPLTHPNPKHLARTFSSPHPRTHHQFLADCIQALTTYARLRAEGRNLFAPNSIVRTWPDKA